MRRWRIGLLLVFLSVVMGGCTQNDQFQKDFKLEESSKSDRFTLTIGRVPSETVMDLLRENSKLITFLRDEMDVNITYSFAENYEMIIRGMSKNQYDVVWLGPYAYVLSRCASETSSQYQPIVQPARPDASGNISSSYRGIIFTNDRSGIKNIQDIKNKKMAFVDPRSTSGYLFPAATLAEHGINLKEDLESYEFLNGHDKVVRAVNEGRFDVGATYEGARRYEMSVDGNLEERLPVLSRTEMIPSSPIVVSKKFKNQHPELAERFKELLVNLHVFPEGEKALEKLNISRYSPTEAADYDVVQQVMAQLRKQGTVLEERVCSQSGL